MATRKELFSQEVIQAVKIALGAGTFDARHIVRYTEQLVNSRQNRSVSFQVDPDVINSPMITISYDIDDPDGKL